MGVGGGMKKRNDYAEPTKVDRLKKFLYGIKSHYVKIKLVIRVSVSVKNKMAIVK